MSTLQLKNSTGPELDPNPDSNSDQESIRKLPESIKYEKSLEKLPRGIEPGLDSKGNLIYPEQIRQFVDNFVNFLVDEIIKDIYEGRKVQMIIPANGGMLAYFELMLKLDPLIAARVSFVFAVKNTDGTYNLTGNLGSTSRIYYLDDISDSEKSFKLIVPEELRELVTTRFLSTKRSASYSKIAHITNGMMPIILEDEWFCNILGMDRGLSNEERSNMSWGLYGPDVELDERMSVGAVKKTSKIEFWTERQVLSYQEFLRNFPHFKNRSFEAQFFRYILIELMMARSPIEKQIIIQRLHQQVLAKIHAKRQIES